VFAPYLISNGLVGALLARGPLVVSACGGDVLAHPDHPRWRRWIQGAVTRFVCRRAHAVHAVSENLEQALLGYGVSPDEIERFPIGVDLETFVPEPGMPRPEALRLICTRSHAPVYDLPTLIRALAILRRSGRRFHCTFAGGGHLLGEHRERVRAAGLHDQVEFSGPVSHHEIPSLLQSADVYVSPSLSDGASESLLEALATGLVPVVTRIDANAPWVRDGETGLLFDPGDAAQLAACLHRALDDGALRERAFRENRLLAETEADIRANMQRIEMLFDRAVARYSGT
jgi:glycosyltransferase involved in cell wall biosynthesis